MYITNAHPHSYRRTYIVVRGSGIKICSSMCFVYVFYPRMNLKISNYIYMCNYRSYPYLPFGTHLWLQHAQPEMNINPNYPELLFSPTPCHSDTHKKIATTHKTLKKYRKNRLHPLHHSFTPSCRLPHQPQNTRVAPCQVSPPSYPWMLAVV